MGYPPLPVILSLLFMIMTTGLWLDRSDSLRAAYNRKCATSCVFEVVLIILQHVLVLKFKEYRCRDLMEIISAGIWYFCQPSNRLVTSIMQVMGFVLADP